MWRIGKTHNTNIGENTEWLELSRTAIEDAKQGSYVGNCLVVFNIKGKYTPVKFRHSIPSYLPRTNGSNCP